MTEASAAEAQFLAYRSWKTKRNLLRRPRRIILIRHGESEANVDSSVYARVPDNKIGLSSRGAAQALDAGRRLREIVGDERVKFYVSPFARSRQTLDGILKGSAIACPIVREDPRLREQEWGNFQDPEVMCKSMARRREVGAFFYRFHEGESGADVYDRVSLFLETLFRDFKSKDSVPNIVLVSHGITLRLFLMRYYKWTIEVFHDLWNPKNATPIILERPSVLAKKFCLVSPLESNRGLWKLYLPAPEQIARHESILPADARQQTQPLLPSLLLSAPSSLMTQSPIFEFPELSPIGTPSTALEVEPHRATTTVIAPAQAPALTAEQPPTEKRPKCDPDQDHDLVR